MRCVFILLLSGCLAPLSFPAAKPLPVDDPYTRGKTQLDAKHYGDAEKSFAQAELASPSQTNALALRAKALIHLGRFEEAQQCLTSYLASRPGSPDAKYLLAYILFRRNMPRESLATYTAAARLQRPGAEDLKVIALDYVLLDDQPDAIHWLQQSIAENPSDPESSYYLGRAYYVQNDFEKAIQAFERALALNPIYGKAENNLGLALAAQGLPDAAEGAYRQAIKMGQASGAESNQPYINLAELLSHTDRQSETLALLGAAEKLGGSGEQIEEVRGQVFLAQNRLAEAERAFRTAIQIAPDKSALHFLLGRVLKREGKSDIAAEEFSRSKTLLGRNSSLPN